MSKGFRLTLIDVVPCLTTIALRERTLLATLVERYLFPEPKNWITEWTGPHGYDIVGYAFFAQKILPFKEAALVIQYLQKSDIFGLNKLEEAAGGKEELRRLLGGTYGPEKPFPLEIDDEMQAQFFFLDGYDHDCPLFWCPRGMTPFIAETIAERHGMKFTCEETDYQALRRALNKLPGEYGDLISPHWVEILYGGEKDRHPLADYGHTPALCDYWIAFPNQRCPRKIISRNELPPLDMSRMDSSKGKPSDQELRRTLPIGWEFPNLLDAVFCIFGKYVYTREHYYAGPILVRSFEDGEHLLMRERYGGDKSTVETWFSVWRKHGEWGKEGFDSKNVVCVPTQTIRGTYAFCQVDSGRWVKLSRGLAPNTLRLTWVALERSAGKNKDRLHLPQNYGNLVAVRKYV